MDMPSFSFYKQTPVKYSKYLFFLKFCKIKVKMYKNVSKMQIKSKKIIQNKTVSFH